MVSNVTSGIVDGIGTEILCGIKALADIPQDCIQTEPKPYSEEGGGIAGNSAYAVRLAFLKLQLLLVVFFPPVVFDIITRTLVNYWPESPEVNVCDTNIDYGGLMQSFLVGNANVLIDVL
eukprot:10122040-Ditylum_brightwellii.AAC.1